MISLHLPHFNKSPNFRKHDTLNPHTHWKKLLTLFLFLMIGLIMFSLYLLYQIRTEQTFEVRPTNQDKPTLLKEDMLKDTLDSFTTKAKKQEEILRTTPTYRDPSI